MSGEGYGRDLKIMNFLIPRLCHRILASFLVEQNIYAILSYAFRMLEEEKGLPKGSSVSLRDALGSHVVVTFKPTVLKKSVRGQKKIFNMV